MKNLINYKTGNMNTNELKYKFTVQWNQTDANKKPALTL